MLGRHGEGDTHHHGLLAGVSAGAMAVLVVFGLMLLAWHRIAGAVGDAVTVIVWAAAAAVIAAVCAAGVYVFLLLRHRVRNPETLARQAVRAEVLDPLPAVMPPAQPLAELPAPPVQYITHNHFHGEDAVEAAIRSHLDRQIAEESP